MRWVIIIGLLLIVVAMIFVNDKKDIDQVMKKVRAAKKKKALERSKVTYTPPAKSEGGLMKVA